MTRNLVSTINSNMDPVKTKITDTSIRLNHFLTVEGLVVPDANRDVAILNEMLAKRLLGAQIKSYGERMYKEAGENMEYLALTCGLNVNVAFGNSVIVHDNGLLKLERSVRNPLKKVNSDQLIDFLRRSGVQEELLQQALVAATSYSKPAVYLTVKSSLD